MTQRSEICDKPYIYETSVTCRFKQADNKSPVSPPGGIPGYQYQLAVYPENGFCGGPLSRITEGKHRLQVAPAD